jgi:glycosyltransferase involved in cell wall biosynthesis
VVLPTLDEAENLAAVVARLRQAVPELEVLVVDDASRDGTADIADALAAADPAVRVLHRTGRRGYGDSLTDGFRSALAAGVAVVASMDCDFSHDPAAMPALLAATEEADVAIGSRYVRGGEIRNWGLYRTTLSATANAFVRALFALPVRDCTSGFRAYRREALETLPWGRLHSTGYSFLVEVLYWICRPGRRVREVPICYVDRTRGKSKMGLRQIVSGAANLLKLRIELARGR